MWWLLVPAAWALGVYLKPILQRWWANRQPQTLEESLEDIEHDIEMIKTAVTLEFLPILEDVMETLTDLLRKCEERKRQQ